jgi:hypothetical protein
VIVEWLNNRGFRDIIMCTENLALQVAKERPRLVSLLAPAKLLSLMGSKGGVLVLVYVALAAGALLSAVLALALLREIRLRRVLESLLRRILSIWRKLHAPNDSDSRPPAASDRDPDERL